jgi:hypothetical protein
MMFGMTTAVFSAAVQHAITERALGRADPPDAPGRPA